jgi:hypothetical protein
MDIGDLDQILSLIKENNAGEDGAEKLFVP